MTPRKLMLLGEIGVGKTSLVRRVVKSEFDPSYRPTIGVDIHRLAVTDAGPAGDQRLDLVIWDTDGNFGQSMFRHVYCKGASAALIIGDVTRQSTLETMIALAEGFQDAFPARPFAFVANKIDLLENPAAVVLPQRLADAAAHVVHTSAKTGSNVARAFTAAATIILRREG